MICVGEMSPVKVRAASSGYRTVRNVVVALLYLALVPVVAASGISLGARYFPDATRALIGPTLQTLYGEIETAQVNEALAASEDRMSKLEQDMVALMSRIDGMSEPAGSSEPADGEDAVDAEALLAPVRAQAAGRDRMLAAFTAMTLARAELLAGNRTVALRELTLAQESLAGDGEGATGVSEQVQKALLDALEALQRNSSAAGDYLSIAWHLLADSLLAIQ